MPAKSLQLFLTFVTLWTVAYQLFLSLGFSRQELKWVVISSVGNMLSQISYAHYSKLIPILKLDYYLHLS